jgi:hypothetical protein
MCTRIYHWHYLSPLVPSVLSLRASVSSPLKEACEDAWAVAWQDTVCHASALSQHEVNLQLDVVCKLVK